EYRVRGQDGEVYRPDYAVARETRRTDTKIVRAYSVMRDVADQEHRRDRTRPHHAEPVTRHLPGHYEREPRQQKNAAESVEKCVEVRKYVQQCVHYFQKPSSTSITIQSAPIKCQYHPTVVARLFWRWTRS